MSINVVISMDKVPSKDNRRVMQYLFAEVNNLKQIFTIRINIIPRRVKNQGEAMIQIGQKKPVSGYAKIIPELKAAAGRVAAVAGADDPFLNYLTQGFADPGQDEKGGVNMSETEMTSAFARATSEREKRKQLQKPPKPGKQKNGEPPKVTTPSIGGRSGARAATVMARDVDVSGDVPNNDHIFTKKHAANAHAGGYAGDPNNSDITELANMPGLEPMAAKFWSSQFTTAGI